MANVHLRTLRERALQAALFEAGGLLLAVPLYALAFEQSAAGSALLLAAVAATVMAWSPVHNSLFDWIDWKVSGRLASDRPHRWRMIHALTHEATAALVTLPVILGFSGLGIWGALALDASLTLFYAAYAYVFHILFDLICPMTSQMAPPPCRAHRAATRTTS